MRKMELIIRRFVKKVKPNARVVFHDGSMETASLSKVIFVNVDEFLCKVEDEDIYEKIMLDSGYKTDILFPTFILLHEIGHIVSVENYKNPKAVIRQYRNQVNRVIYIKDTEKRIKAYKNLKVEKDADDFAYNFYLNNYDLVIEFDKEIRKFLF